MLQIFSNFVLIVYNMFYYIIKAILILEKMKLLH